MTKTVLFASVAVLSASFWAAHGQAYNRPEFNLSADSQVAIGDTKIDDGEEVASTSVTTEVLAVADGEESKPVDTNGFSVRLISIHGGRKSNKSKSTSSNKGPALAGAANIDNGGNYTIQLSSSLTETDAQKSLQQFQSAKVPLTVWTATAQVSGQTRYRVYYGHFKSLEEARAAKSKVAEESGVKEAFVQKVFGKLTAKND